jgi:hypothetical protein
MIAIDITKAKAIAHEKRRAARAAEFAPLDEVIAKQIPGANVQAVEVERQAVREKYAAMQNAIDEAANVDAIKAAMPS